MDKKALIISGEWTLGGGNWFVNANTLLININKIGGANASAILSIDGELSGRFYFVEKGAIEFDELESTYEDEECFNSDEYEDGFRVLAKQHLLSLIAS